MANRNKSHRRARVAVLMVLCSAVFAAFFARLAWMQFVKADYYADKAAEASSASYTVTQHAARGPILEAGHCSAVRGPVKPSAWGSSAPSGQLRTPRAPTCARPYKP